MSVGSRNDGVNHRYESAKDADKRKDAEEVENGANLVDDPCDNEATQENSK